MMKNYNFYFVFILSVYISLTIQHNLAPEQPNYKCFEKDPEPVSDETFDGYCKDYEGNIHYENAYVTSCCECIRYRCDYLGSINDKRFFYWNKTVSDHCCLYCDGTVHKADTTIETVVEEDECGTKKTAYCRKNEFDVAVIQIDFKYEWCCNDEEGISFTGTAKLEASTCSVRTCEYSNSSLHSSWISRQEINGCNCCIHNGTLIADGTEWEDYECCDGQIVKSVSEFDEQEVENLSSSTLQTTTTEAPVSTSTFYDTTTQGTDSTRIETTSTFSTTAPSSQCEEGWTYFQHTQNCFKYVSNPTTPQAANEYCKTLSIQGSLVSIHDAETNSFISSFSTTSNIWLGGYRVVVGQDVWAWTDNSVWDYENWSSNNPNHPNSQHYVSMYTTGEWDDNWPTTALPFVCQYNSTAITVTEAPVSTSTLYDT